MLDLPARAPLALAAPAAPCSVCGTERTDPGERAWAEYEDLQQTFDMFLCSATCGILGIAKCLEQVANYALLTGLYTDESPGLKVDPVVVLVLSLVFIFSVVALHSKENEWSSLMREEANTRVSYCQAYPPILQLNGWHLCLDGRQATEGDAELKSRGRKTLRLEATWCDGNRSVIPHPCIRHPATTED